MAGSGAMRSGRTSRNASTGAAPESDTSRMPNADPCDRACTIGTPLTTAVTGECVCPLTMASTRSVSPRARSTISPQQAGGSVSQNAPAWATTTTTLRFRAVPSRAAVDDRNGIDEAEIGDVGGLVVVGVWTVAAPTIPRAGSRR